MNLNLSLIVTVALAVGVGVLMTLGLLDQVLGGRIIDLILVGIGGAAGFAVKGNVTKPPAP